VKATWSVFILFSLCKEARSSCKFKIDGRFPAHASKDNYSIYPLTDHDIMILGNHNWWALSTGVGIILTLKIPVSRFKLILKYMLCEDLNSMAIQHWPREWYFWIDRATSDSTDSLKDSLALTATNLTALNRPWDKTCGTSTVLLLRRALSGSWSSQPRINHCAARQTRILGQQSQS
jgi:hypothetical protein